MDEAVAVDAERLAIAHLESQGWIIGPALDVVGVDFIGRSAFAAFVFVAREHGRAPHPQFWAQANALIFKGRAALPLRTIGTTASPRA